MATLLIQHSKLVLRCSLGIVDYPGIPPNNTRRSEATNSTQITIHVPSNEQNFEPSAPEMDLSPFPPTYEEAMHMKSMNC